VEWVVTSGRTIDEATEVALDQLGVDEQDAEIEIVQDAQKGLFGRLRAEAQVRARVRPTAPRPKVDRRDRRRGGDRRGGRDGDRGRGRNRQGGGGSRERARSNEGSGGRTAVAPGSSGNGDAGADRSDTAERAAAAGTQKGQQGSRGRGGSGSSSSSRRRRSRASRTAEGATVSQSTQSERSTVDELDLEAQRAAVEEFLTELLNAFGRSDATVSVGVSDEDQALEASVEGSELGLLVGQKGVTLTAVQELVRSMVQRRFVGQAHARVRVDVAGYRARRKEALQRFATSVAESVKESGVAKALDPMGSADRKVVHDVINEIDGVETISEGEDTARRVIIRPA
jgi:spoIIIJ-associated protein